MEETETKTATNDEVYYGNCSVDDDDWKHEKYLFRVHDGLRLPNKKAYTPLLTSIGPYHRERKELRAMEVHKHRYLNLFLARTEEYNEESYKKSLKSRERKARGFYAGKIENLSSDAFVDMLLLDGSFLVEFIRKLWEKKSSSQTQRNEDPIFYMEWMLLQTFRDMLLFENQLPYFVLSELYEMSKDPRTEESFIEMVSSAFATMLPRICPLATVVIDRVNLEDKEIKHLLQVVQILCRPPSEKGSTSSRGNTYQIRCVSELQEAGVSFKKMEKVLRDVDGGISYRSTSIFDIKFDNGVMKIPSIKVDYSTESFLRNLIAYEQHSPDVSPKYFTDYSSFMDQLIDYARDATTLRLEGIIVNFLGKDKEVARLFNKLNEGVIVSSDFYYSGVCLKANQYCEQPWNLVMAKLRRDYFNSPWAGISTAAAVLLLVLTVTQTVATIVSLKLN